MNAGANCGINVIYSGTVAAAIEGAFLGIPAIATSLHLGSGRPDFDEGARHAVRAIERILKADLLEAHSCVNVNIPRCEVQPGEDLNAGQTLEDLGLLRAVAERNEQPAPKSETLPIRVCPMNVHGLVDKYERRQSPSGEMYLWPAGHGLDFHSTDEGTDVAELIEHRCITVTSPGIPLSASLRRSSTTTVQAEWVIGLGKMIGQQDWAHSRRVSSLHAYPSPIRLVRCDERQLCCSRMRAAGEQYATGP